MAAQERRAERKAKREALRQKAITERRRARWGLQNTAKRLMPRERVCGCMSGVRPGAEGVTILRTAQGAHYGGLVTCGSVWMCPICAAKITEKRRTQELKPALHEARTSHIRVLMITYTFSHHAHQGLKTLVERFTEAQERMKSGRAAKSRKARYGLIGTVRALECTWGQENGWHPHIHELVFLPAEVDHEAYVAELRAAWSNAARAAGLTMNEHGFDWTDTNERIADYVAKFGRDPEWDESNELTKWHVKRGDADHMTPFQLLAAAGEGDDQAARLFQEYCRVFKGRRQLVWSPGLRAVLGLQEQEESDEELAASQEEEAVALGQLTRDQWKVVVANDMRVEVLEAAETGGWPAVEELLEMLAG